MRPLLVFLCAAAMAGCLGADDASYLNRMDMVENQLVARGVSNLRVLDAMKKVPRHEFVPGELRKFAYEDGPLPIGHGQTISQPYIVALMTELLDLAPASRVLEVGTGSGYQAAILAELAASVYTIEIVPELSQQAEKILARLGYRNVHARVGDGHAGWPEAAPFDAIVVTCAPDDIPPQLVEQLREGGRLVVPVGPAGDVQELYLLEKSKGKILQKSITAVRFVPMLHGNATRE